MLFRFIILFFLLINQTSLWAIEYSDSCGKDWNWESPLPQGNSLLDIIWLAEQKQFIAVGHGGTILTSPDAKKWQTQASGTKEWLRGVSSNGRQIVAVGENGTVLTSTDTINWQIQISAIVHGTTQYTSITSEYLNAISWNGESWVIVGNGGTILSSKDAVLWKVENSGTTQNLSDIYWNGKLWV
ncbi:MAG: hypothetical protein QM504_06285, partial [Pseudomonadota bacterium]